MKTKTSINSFHATGLFRCPLKTSENLWFSDVFRGYRKRPVAWNGLRVGLNLRLWWKKFVIVNNIGCPAVMAVKLKEHSQIHEIHEYFSNYLQPSLIGSDGNVFADKAKNMCFGWSNDCGDFFLRHLVEFILTILKRNISPLKLLANTNGYAQIYLAAKSPVIPPKGNLPQK